MFRRTAALLVALAALLSAALPARAAGVIPLALTQQQDINGRPLAGCLLYIYQVGTVATLQNAFQDFGLTIAMPNPMACDQTGRLPMFYLADGQVHVRLTDSGGMQQLDIPVMQVLGPSSGGGGGGGGGNDPSSVASTGDLKFRLSGEVLTGWVKANGQTIGSPTSGASQRANADTQSLFIWIWNNCPDAKCPVGGGRGGSGLADFNANKTVTLLDMRGRGVFGLNDMGAANSGIITALAFSGGDTGTTIGAAGGLSQFTLTANELAAHTHPLSTAGTTSTEAGTHTHAISITTGIESGGHTHSGSTGIENSTHTHGFTAVVGLSSTFSAGPNPTGAANPSGSNTGIESVSHTHSFTTGNISADHTHLTSGTSATQTGSHTHTLAGLTANSGSGNPLGLMNPFRLGSWYLKL